MAFKFLKNSNYVDFFCYEFIIVGLERLIKMRNDAKKIYFLNNEISDVNKVEIVSCACFLTGLSVSDVCELLNISIISLSSDGRSEKLIELIPHCDRKLVRDYAYNGGECLKDIKKAFVNGYIKSNYVRNSRKMKKFRKRKKSLKSEEI